MNIAIVIGHSRTKQGAVNKRSGLTEFAYNEPLALEIGEALAKIGHTVNIIYRHAYNQLPHDINTTNPDIVVSLHCNAYNEKATGSEVLYWNTSLRGKQAAQIFLDAICESLKLSCRGIKPKNLKSRGGFVLRNTDAPCIILEPFFIDNDLDLQRAIKNHYQFAQALIVAFEILSFVWKMPLTAQH